MNVHAERLLFSTEGHIYPIDDRFNKVSDRDADINLPVPVKR